MSWQGELLLIDGAVYTENRNPSMALRYVGELPSEVVPGYCLHVFRHCRSGKLRAMPYTEAEKQLTLRGNP